MRRALSAAARVLGRPLEVRDRRRQVDALVVLGSPTRDDGSLSEVGEERVRHAVDLWRQGVAPLVVFSGAGADHSPPEAPAMAARARALGLPAAAIRVEARSRSTRENARFSAELLAAEGAREVWLVTQPFHLRRARALFRRCGLAAFAAPHPASIQYRRPSWALRWISREYAALVAERLRR